MKQQPYDVHVPVLVVTWATSRAEAIRQAEEELGDNGFFPEPDHCPSQATQSEVVVAAEYDHSSTRNAS